MSRMVPAYILRAIAAQGGFAERLAEERAKVVEPTPVGGHGSCACETCQRACLHKPGWFLPGEAEEAARYLGLSLQEFFDAYLAADHWPEMDGEPRLFILSPAPTYLVAGTPFSFFQNGACVFFRGGRCRIHAVRPYECRALLHGEDPRQPQARHREVMRQWSTAEAQQQIWELLEGIHEGQGEARRQVEGKGTGAGHSERGGRR